MADRTEILGARQADLKLDRIAFEIVEQNLEEGEIVLAGIADRGLHIAGVLKQKIERIGGPAVRLLTIRIDKENPIAASVDDPGFSASDKTIILVDDVASSGRTLLYACRLFLDAIPKKIQMAVLVDRMHKRYPVTNDYIGLMLSTNLQEHIHVVINKQKEITAYIE